MDCVQNSSSVHFSAEHSAKVAEKMGNEMGMTMLPGVSEVGDVLSTLGAAGQLVTNPSGENLGKTAVAAGLIAVPLASAGSAKNGGKAVKALVRWAKKTSCFAAGTPILTEDGLKPIEEVVVGDRVWSRDAESGEEGWKRVVGTQVRHDQPVLRLVVSTTENPGRSAANGAPSNPNLVQTIDVTAEHPFWVGGQGWVPAREVEPGDTVRTADGRWMQVRAGTWLADRATVYNFEVRGYHTYFAGEPGVWVHNACNPIDELGNPTDEMVGIIKSGERTGSAGRKGNLTKKGDHNHQAPNFVGEKQLRSGKAFKIEGHDGVERTLVQTEGKLDGDKGVFEWIIEPSNEVSHQIFIKGGEKSGRPNDFSGD